MRVRFAGMSVLLLALFAAILAPSSLQAQSDKARRATELFERLVQDMRSLERLGYGELAQQVENVAGQLKRRIGKQREEKHEGKERGGERRIKEHLEMLRLVHKAMLEADKKDAAELAEHAIHAGELRLEGRRDKEARRVMEKSPKLPALIELTAYASKLWAKWGHESKAKALSGYSRALRARWEKQRAQERRPEARKERRERPERGERRRPIPVEEQLERQMERIERLEQSMRRMGTALERLMKALEKRR